MTPLYLASGSPRRRELLAQIGVPFTLVAAPIDETPLPGEGAADYVERLARAKAAAGLAQVQGAGVVLGPTPPWCSMAASSASPKTVNIPGHAGRTFRSRAPVLTAVALTDGQRCLSACVASTVRFRAIGASEAERYWASGEPQDKAGGYAIQGLGAVFVTGLTGSYSAVVGLPLSETADLLGQFAIACWQQHEVPAPR